MVGIASQLNQYFAEAEKEAVSRSNDLRQSILEEFSRGEGTANSEAFTEPDYQYVLKSAHEAFARSGEESLKGELVRLLAQRSAKPSGSRVALILNEAISVAGRLTPEEYAVITILFLVNHVKVGGSTKHEMARLYSIFLSPFVANLPASRTSYEYLESMRCVSINTITSRNLPSQLCQNYWKLFSMGFNEAALEAALGSGAELVRPFLVKSQNHYGGNLQFDANDEAELRTKIAVTGLSEEHINEAVSLHLRSIPSHEKILEEFKDLVPLMVEVEGVWSTTPLRQCSLTALGQALAHSSLVSAAPHFNAPLDIWLQ